VGVSFTTTLLSRGAGTETATVTATTAGPGTGTGTGTGEGWIAGGATVGAGNSSSSSPLQLPLPPRTNYNLRGHRAQVSSSLYPIECYITRPTLLLLLQQQSRVEQSKVTVASIDLALYCHLLINFLSLHYIYKAIIANRKVFRKTTNGLLQTKSIRLGN